MPVTVQQYEEFTFYHPVSKAGLNLNDEINYRVLHHDGFGIGDFENLAVGVPELHGEFWYDMRFQAKVISLDVRIIAQSFIDLEDKKSQLMDFFNPVVVNPRIGNTPVLRVRQANGKELQINCILHEAATLPTQQYIGQQNARYIFRFRTLAEPFWYEAFPQEIVYYLGATTGFRFPWRLPFFVGSGGILQRPVLHNNGHAPTPVRVDITGPGSSPILTNETTSRRIAFENVGAPLVLLAGEHLIVDTDPFKQIVEKNGVPVWNTLSEAEFWQIEVGYNQLRFDMGGTGAGSSIKVNWARRYLGM
jgi:hypothetical protein